MLKIALVGAPSSGKTALALALRDTLGYEVVDDYIGDIEDRSDNTLGHFASYLGNLQAAIGRWEAERRCLRDGKVDSLITCGTIIETLVYNGVQALVQAHADSEAMTLRAIQNDKRSSLSMMLLGVITHDTWDYDHAFYLPLPEDASDEAKLVDKYIIETAETVDIQLTTLPLTTEAQLPVVLQEVLANEKAIKRELRPSNEPSEEAGLQGGEGSSDGVSNMQDPA